MYVRNRVLIALFAIFAAVSSGAAPPTFAGNSTTAGYNDFVSSNAGLNVFSGININNFLGANTFYNAGYTGSHAIVANIEAGSVWNGHETLTQVNTFLHATEAGTQLGQFDRHATWVGATINGNPTAGGGEYQRGIAYGATLWSGAIATSWVPPAYSLNFNIDNLSFTTPYYQAMQAGVNGHKADVVNSSFNYTDTSGQSDLTVMLDALAAQNGTTLVVSAGNSGPNTDTVGAPATGYNNLTVAALGSDTDAQPYNTVSSFSSRGPSDFYNPVTDQTITGVRATVDIAAPGQNLTLAYYGGATGGNSGGTDVTGGANNIYQSNLAGTSFSAPTVAGGATLLADAGHANFGGGTSVDGRVIKAVLLNSADKTAGWNNAQYVGINGVVTTTQALDYSVGAGRMNLTNAYTQYLDGTTDVTGTGGGTVQIVGWDKGQVGAGHLYNDYVFSQPLQAGTNFTGTLDWFADRTASFSTDATGTEFTAASDNSLSDLNLALYEVIGGQNQLVAQSISQYNNTEHFSFTLQNTGDYFLRALWNGDIYGSDTSADYGLAWSDISAAPEPSSFSVLGIVAATLFGCLWRKRQQRAAQTDA